MTDNAHPDILCFSSSDWYGIWGSRQQVMTRFARRGYRVLFVERQAGLEHLWRYPDLRRRKARRWREGLHVITENVWAVSPPPLLPGRYYATTINRINQWFVRHGVRRYLKKLRFEEPILWLYKPEQSALIGQFGERLSIYHCIDEFSVGTRGRKRHIIQALEADLLRRVDLVFANSRLTYENKCQLNLNTHRVPSGADVDHFAQAMDPQIPSHPAIANIPHPIAGFIGNIAKRIDIPFLARVIEKLPDWHFVFVGGYYPHLVDLSPLTKFSNVHLLGKHPFHALPSLAKEMDIFLFPYVNDERARYRSPLKLYEYLAAGRPVVSTRHPEVQEMEDVVEIAATPDEFVAKLRSALLNDNFEQQQRRLAVARQNSWDSRVDKMEHLLCQASG
mgnify:CR=1 FL=1